MRIKEGYVINKLGREYVIVPVGEAGMEFNGVIRLNASGAFLWQCIADGAGSREELIRAMLNHYDDLDETTAGQDLDEFLDAVAFALEE